MTKKHLELIAATLRNARPADGSNSARVQWWDTVDEFVRTCAASNASFKRDRFIAACCKEA